LCRPQTLPLKESADARVALEKEDDDDDDEEEEDYNILLVAPFLILAVILAMLCWHIKRQEIEFSGRHKKGF